MPNVSKMVRVLLTISVMDCHVRGIRYLTKRLRDAGMEVIFTEYRSPEEIVATAEQEDVDIIGISFLSGGQNYVVPKVLSLLKERGLNEIPVIIGGIIPEEEATRFKALGVGEVFGAGSSVPRVIQYILNGEAARTQC